MISAKQIFRLHPIRRHAEIDGKRLFKLLPIDRTNHLLVLMGLIYGCTMIMTSGFYFNVIMKFSCT